MTDRIDLDALIDDAAKSPELDDLIGTGDHYKGTCHIVMSQLAETLVALCSEIGLFADGHGKLRSYSGRVDLTDDQRATLGKLGIITQWQRPPGAHR